MLDERNLGEEIRYCIILLKFSDERYRTACDDTNRVRGPDHATLLHMNLRSTNQAAALNRLLPRKSKELRFSAVKIN